MSVAAPEQVRVAAHAKVNLFLRILAREHSTGHHQVETAFALLELADELVAVRRGAPGEVSLTVNGPDLGPVEEMDGALVWGRVKSVGRGGSSMRDPYLLCKLCKIPSTVVTAMG